MSNGWDYTPWVLRSVSLGLVEDDTFVLHLEPLHGILLGHPVLDPNTGLAPAAASDAVPSALKDDVEVHSINTSGRIIPDTNGKKVHQLPGQFVTEKEHGNILRTPFKQSMQIRCK